MVERRKRRVGIHLWSSEKLHQVAHTMRSSLQEREWTRRQEWLWSCVVVELEYRHKRANRFEERCHCDLCVPPFHSRPTRLTGGQAEEAELQLQLDGFVNCEGDPAG